MADKKISQLTGAATPLAGAEVLPVVQGGNTVKVSVANLTAGRDVNAASMVLTNNLGVGVTPSAWSAIKAVQVGTGGSFSAGNGFNDTFVASNAYYDGSNWRYINTNPAFYNSVGGSATARWFSAISGNAGDAITFTQVMDIGTNGNVTANIGDFVVGTAGKGITTSVTNGNVTITPNGTGTTVLNRNGLRIPNNAAVTVGTSATQISVNAISWSSLAFVFGVDGGGNAFSDLVFYADGTAVALASRTVSAAPAVRTYTAPGGQLNLAMGSGSYSVFFQHIWAA